MEPTTPAPNTPPTQPVMPAAEPSSGMSPMLKIFLVVLGVVIVAELAWAGYTLTRPVQPAAETQVAVASPTPSAAPAIAVIALDGQTEATVGGLLQVDIDIATTEPTDGTDVLINYDPKVLSATGISSGTLYPEYPVKKIDAIKGQISLSGVALPETVGFSGEGILGSVTFKALRAGQTTLSVDYVADGTTDSNVLGSQAQKDILNAVKHLTVTIR